MTNWKADKGKTYGWCGWINKSVGLSVFVKKYCLKNWQIANQTQIQTTIWWAKRQNGRTEWGRGYKCAGRLNCGIDSHSTGHVGSPSLCCYYCTLCTLCILIPLQCLTFCVTKIQPPIIMRCHKVVTGVGDPTLPMLCHIWKWVGAVIW